MCRRSTPARGEIALCCRQRRRRARPGVYCKEDPDPRARSFAWRHALRDDDDDLKDLGKPYDPFFTDDDARISCSELVWRAWRAAGLKPGEVKTGRELALEGPQVKRLLGERWRNHPRCKTATTIDACAAVVAAQDIVTPASLMRDRRLQHVAGALP